MANWLATAAAYPTGTFAIVSNALRLRLCMLSSDCCYFLEGCPGGLEHCSLAGQLLPALNPHVDISRIELDREAGPPEGFCSGHRCPAARERFIDGFGGPSMVEDRTPHERDGFLRWVG